MTAALQCWEEVVQEDALAWLDLSALALRGLFVALSRRVFGSSATTRVNCGNVTLRVDLSSSLGLRSLSTIVENST